MCATTVMSSGFRWAAVGTGWTTWRASISSAASWSGVPKYFTVPCVTTNSRVTGPSLSR